MPGEGPQPWMLELARMLILCKPEEELPASVIVGSAVIERCEEVRDQKSEIRLTSDLRPLTSVYEWHLTDIERVKIAPIGANRVHRHFTDHSVDHLDRSLTYYGGTGPVVWAPSATLTEKSTRPQTIVGVFLATITACVGQQVRANRMSLWNPGVNWLAADPTEPCLTYLPSSLWIIGLGNLGQAYAWLLASLPYPYPERARIVLQDFDRIAASNDSTSILSYRRDIGRRKARMVAEWLDARGFETILEERRFGHWSGRASDEPAVALCGVDNANARADLEDVGFGLIVEAGLGAGPQSFRNIFMHSFPATRSAADIWRAQIGASPETVTDLPAYQALQSAGMDQCGVTRLASRTVGVPFVGVIAGCLVVSELLRRLHGGAPLELASVSVATLDDVEKVASTAVVPYAFGHVECAEAMVKAELFGR